MGAVKVHFSLRALLVVVTLAALLCLWRDRPRRVAERFVEAIESKQFATADALLADGEHAFVATFMAGDERNRIAAKRLAPSLGDWLNGRCFVAVKLEDFSGLGATIQLNVTSTACGIVRRMTPESTSAFRYAPDPLLRRDIQVR